MAAGGGLDPQGRQGYHPTRDSRRGADIAPSRTVDVDSGVRRCLRDGRARRIRIPETARKARRAGPGVHEVSLGSGAAGQGHWLRSARQIREMSPLLGHAGSGLFFERCWRAGMEPRGEAGVGPGGAQVAAQGRPG